MTLLNPFKRIIQFYLDGWRSYADFGGRSSWREYLSFFAVNLSIGLCLHGLEAWRQDGFFGLIALLYGFAVLLPGLAVTVRFLRGLLA